MNERLMMIPITLADPNNAAGLSTLHYYFDCIFDMTIVAVSAAPEKDDSGTTIDIDDDGSNVITAISAADADVPGTWKSTHVGGTNAPVHIAAGSKVSFDCNSAGNGVAILVVLWALVGEVSA